MQDHSTKLLRSCHNQVGAGHQSVCLTLVVVNPRFTGHSGCILYSYDHNSDRELHQSGFKLCTVPLATGLKLYAGIFAQLSVVYKEVARKLSAALHNDHAAESTITSADTCLAVAFIKLWRNFVIKWPPSGRVLVGKHWHCLPNQSPA